MRRRDFVTLLGGAAAWPLTGHAQQSAMPVIGWLHTSSADSRASSATAFRFGLSEAGYYERQNVGIQYRWADDHYDRLPDLVADLVRRNVTLIVAAGLPSAIAAKKATSEIPIVFQIGADPVALGLVASLGRPGGNITGVVNLSNTLVPKRVEMIHEVVPDAKRIAVLLNPDNQNFPLVAKDVQGVQKPLGVQIEILRARSSSDIDPSFEKIAALRAGALVVGSDPFFNSQVDRIAVLAARMGVPTIHELSGFPKAGGLMSYGADLVDAFRLAGIYTGRVLKGEKPSDLPVQQATKVALVINLKAAKTLGLTIPLPLLSRADEVIE
jgi:putative ABC transport system substrate-binding protein